MVSEALQADTDVPNLDLSGLHNVSKKVKDDKPPPEDDQKQKEKLGEQEMTFTETLSLNSVTTDG